MYSPRIRIAASPKWLQLIAQLLLAAITLQLNRTAVNSFDILDNPIYGGIGDQYQFYAAAVNVCADLYDGVAAADWSSSNTAVATIDSDGNMSFVGAGTTTVSASSRLSSVNNCCCRTQIFTSHAAANVAPTITQDKQLWYFGGFPTPSTFSQGGTTVTLTASGATQGTFSWSLSNGSGNASALFENDGTTITKTNSNSVSLTSQGQSLTTSDSILISLTYTDPWEGIQTVSYLTTIESPYSLIKSGDDNLYGAAYCQLGSPPPPGSNGWAFVKTYDVISRLGGVQVGSEYVHEMFEMGYLLHSGDTKM